MGPFSSKTAKYSAGIFHFDKIKEIQRNIGFLHIYIDALLPTHSFKNSLHAKKTNLGQENRFDRNRTFRLTTANDINKVICH